MATPPKTDSAVTAETGTDVPPAKNPGWWKVRCTHPINNNRTVFRSLSERRARDWLVKRCPRGEEFHLESPDGILYSYNENRLNDDGSDADVWGIFDPEEWAPPGNSTPPPGSAGWPDQEG